MPGAAFRPVPALNLLPWRPAQRALQCRRFNQWLGLAVLLAVLAQALLLTVWQREIQAKQAALSSLEHPLAMLSDQASTAQADLWSEVVFDVAGLSQLLATRPEGQRWQALHWTATDRQWRISAELGAEQ